jgi:cytochrome c553
MYKPFRIAGFTVAALVVFAAIAVAVVSVLSERKMHRTVDIAVAPVTLAPDASLERGHYLYATRGCMSCHGADGSGKVVIGDRDGSGMYVRSPNITRAPGSVTERYTDADWIAVVRHGVKPSKQPLLIMPSEDYAQLATDDVAALVAYIRNLPPAAGGGAEIRLPLPLKALYAFGGFQDAAEKIDHRRPAPEQAPVTPHERGAYAAQTCIGCHGQGFAGGKIPGTPPSWPLAANLTSADDSAMTRYYPSFDSFREMIRTGKRPDGTVVRVMPFAALRMMSNQELQELFEFLKRLQPKTSGTR